MGISLYPDFVVAQPHHQYSSTNSGIGAIIDVETTGLSPARDEIVELGILLFGFEWGSGRVVGVIDEYVGFREPTRAAISPGAAAVHGITTSMVKGQELDHQRISTLLDRAEFVVAHNAQFDYGFVVQMYPKAARKPWLCSMRHINWSRHGYRYRGLQKLLIAHGIHIECAHRAGADCRAALTLLGYRSGKGHTYLRELLLRLSS